MSSRFYLKVGDREPEFRAVLSLSGGAPIDFTAASAALVLKQGSTVKRLNATILSTTANSATVGYAWATNEFTAAGEWDGEVEVTRNNGKVITFPNGYYFKVIVKEDLR